MGGPCARLCVCARVHAPNLTRYHMKMVLKAFSLEQEPQDMVMSWDIPLGATCREGNSRGLMGSLRLDSRWPELGLCRGIVWAGGGWRGGTGNVPQSSGTEESGQGSCRGCRRSQEGPRAGGDGEEQPRLSSPVQPSSPEIPMLYGWEVEIQKDLNRHNN